MKKSPEYSNPSVEMYKLYYRPLLFPNKGEEKKPLNSPILGLPKVKHPDLEDKT